MHAHVCKTILNSSFLLLFSLEKENQVTSIYYFFNFHRDWRCLALHLVSWVNCTFYGLGCSIFSLERKKENQLGLFRLLHDRKLKIILYWYQFIFHISPCFHIYEWKGAKTWWFISFNDSLVKRWFMCLNHLIYPIFRTYKTSFLYSIYIFRYSKKKLLQERKLQQHLPLSTMPISKSLDKKETHE